MIKLFSRLENVNRPMLTFQPLECSLVKHINVFHVVKRLVVVFKRLFNAHLIDF